MLVETQTIPKIILFGASGNLGHAIGVAANPNGSRGRARALVHTPSRALFAKGPAAWDLVMAAVDREPVVSNDEPIHWIFAAGLTDPTQHPETLSEANFALPARWIAAILSRRPRDRVITFGTLLENFDEIAAKNSYVASKQKLAQFMRGTDKPGQLVHFQLHTLYGGTPRPHLFLGQLVQSLRENMPLRMTAGRQLREYHAQEDIAEFVVRGVQNGLPAESIALLSHGEPVMLGELAQFVFAELGKLPLLQLGALPDPAAENWNRTFSRSPEAWGLLTRDSKAGVLQYVRSQLRISS